LSFGVLVLCAAAAVLVPGAPLVSILFLSQALNAVLLLVLLPFMRRIARDPAVMGAYAMTRWDRALTGIVLAMVAVSVTALLALTIT
jgi:Mn2+/Fe2+ NRAMP family transporter